MLDEDEVEAAAKAMRVYWDAHGPSVFGLGSIATRLARAALLAAKEVEAEKLRKSMAGFDDETLAEFAEIERRKRGAPQ